MARECLDKCPNLDREYSEGGVTLIPITNFINKVPIVTFIPIVHPDETDTKQYWLKQSNDCPGPIKEVQTVDKSFASIRRFFGKPTTEQVVVYTCPMEK